MQMNDVLNDDVINNGDDGIVANINIGNVLLFEELIDINQ